MQIRLAGLGLLLLALNGPAAVLYVDLNSTNPAAPYTDWTTAATRIQDAVDAAHAGDLVLVTNGLYDAGGRQVASYAVTNRVLVTNAITLRSINGPAVTTIQGYQAPPTSPVRRS